MIVHLYNKFLSWNWVEINYFSTKNIIEGKYIFSKFNFLLLLFHLSFCRQEKAVDTCQNNNLFPARCTVIALVQMVLWTYHLCLTTQSLPSKDNSFTKLLAPNNTHTPFLKFKIKIAISLLKAGGTSKIQVV